MLKIRMQRIGRINSPSYRVVVIEHARAPQAGKFVEKVGSYNPKTKEKTLNADRIKYWMSVGAKPSDTVHNMLIGAGIITGKKINVLPKFVEAEKAPEPEVAAPAPVEEAPVVEEPPAIEETPAEAPVEQDIEPVEAVAATEE